MGRELVGEPGPFDVEVGQGLGHHRPLVGGSGRDQEALGDGRVVQLGGAHGQGEARDGRSLGNAHIGHEAGDARLGQQAQCGAGAAGEDEALRRDAHSPAGRNRFSARGGTGPRRPALEGPSRGLARYCERARTGQDGTARLFDGGPQRLDKDEHAALDAGFGGAARSRGGQARLDRSGQGPVTGGLGAQSGSDRIGRQHGRVGGVDARDDRPHRALQHGLPHARGHETGQGLPGLVHADAAAHRAILKGAAHPGLAEHAGAVGRVRASRDSQERVAQEGAQLPAAAQGGGVEAGARAGGLDRGQPQGVHDRRGVGAAHDVCFRAQVYVRSADRAAGDEAAQVAARLDQEGAHARAGQFPRAHGSGDASTDNDRAGVGGDRVQGAHRASPSSCTSSTMRVSTSGSVVGGTPCPRLKTWQGAERPASRISRTACSITCHGA